MYKIIFSQLIAWWIGEMSGKVIKKKSATFIQIKAANNHYWMLELL